MQNDLVDQLRIGTGFDVHPFCEGRPLMIGGLQIPHSHGLLGHSDADVLIHAIVDSILGALGLGDIGQYFPPGDPRWKDASSSKFLEHTRNLAKERGARILSIDSTLIMEAPKMSPYYSSIRENLCRILDLPRDRLHLKATTTEKLGFLGRSEGIAAQAVCLLCIGRDKTTG